MFAAALPRERWPDRGYREGIAPAPDYAPATGRGDVDTAGEGALREGLAALAGWLYGGPLFRALYSLDPGDCGGRRPTVALRLRADREGGARTLAYDPAACAFVPVEAAAAHEEFIAGIECWARDLAGLFAGELGPTALCYAGRLRVWNHAPARVPFAPHLLWMFAHPLRRPEAMARLYRRLVAAAGEVAPVIRFAG